MQFVVEVEHSDEKWIATVGTVDRGDFNLEAGSLDDLTRRVGETLLELVRWPFAG